MTSVQIENLLKKVRRAGKLKASEYLETGDFPVIDQGAGEIAGYSNDFELVHQAPLPVVVFGDHTRRVKFVTEPFICGADGTQLLYPNDETIDLTYFYYAIKNIDLSNYFYARHFKFLKDQYINIPSPEVQRLIGKWLKCYDHLIKNNRRRIDLLEESARLLFREWFGNQGWFSETCQLITLDKFVFSHIGGGWGKDNAEGHYLTPVNVIRGTDLAALKHGGNGGAGVRYEKENSVNSRRLEQADVIFEVSGGSHQQPVARTHLVTNGFLERFNNQVICASFCKRVRFAQLHDAVFFHYHCIESRENGHILQFQKESASSLKNFNWSAFLENYRINLPSVELRRRFFETINSSLLQMDCLAAQNSKLEVARDLLLPRLMDRRVAV